MGITGMKSTNTLGHNKKVMLCYDYYLAGMSHESLLKMVNLYNWFDRKLTMEEFIGILSSFKIKTRSYDNVSTQGKELFDMTSKSIDPMHIGDSGLASMEDYIDQYNTHENQFGY